MFKQKITFFAGVIMFVSAICVLSVFIPDANATYGDTYVGGRAAGFGGAFSAVADDVTAVYYNPAGLGFMTKPEFVADFSRLLTGLDDKSDLSSKFIGYTFGISTKKKYYGQFAVSMSNMSLAGYVQYNTYYFSYAQRRNFVSVGMNLKLLAEEYQMTGYTGDDNVFGNGARSYVQNVSIDLAGMVNVAPKLFVGLNLTDINQPDMRMLKTDRVPADTDKIPFGLRAGVSYKEKTYTGAIDVAADRTGTKMYAGFEKWFFKNKQAAVRAGAGFGTKEFLSMSMGFSVNMNEIQVDYCFLMPMAGISDITGSHRFTFVYRFAVPSVKENAPGTIEYNYAVMELEYKKLKQDNIQLNKENIKLREAVNAESALRIKEKMSYISLISTQGVMVPGTIDQPAVVVPEPVVVEPVKQEEPAKKEENPAKNESQMKEQLLKMIQSQQKVESSTPPAVAQPPEPAPVQPVQQETVPVVQPVSSAPEQDENVIIHVIQQGDTLATISEQYYGSSAKWGLIYSLNKDKIKKEGLKPGVELKVPLEK
jgi:hypothetical protein